MESFSSFFKKSGMESFMRNCTSAPPTHTHTHYSRTSPENLKLNGATWQLGQNKWPRIYWSLKGMKLELAGALPNRQSHTDDTDSDMKSIQVCHGSVAGHQSMYLVQIPKIKPLCCAALLRPFWRRSSKFSCPNGL
jgi:hypothetical protein